MGRWGGGNPPLTPPRRGIWGGGEIFIKGKSGKSAGLLPLRPQSTVRTSLQVHGATNSKRTHLSLLLLFL
ncbi:hypothetical protein, partial [Moorena sp. SIO3I8]|uniref:hypothetical protein n=1 Tax=Moorena sp. SIO3I8 TaxID=2607833 RepID=UPI0013C1A1AB